MAELDALMRKPTSSTQLAAFVFVDSRWREPHDAVQCSAHGSTFEFLFEFQTEFFSNFLFGFQVVRESNCSTFDGPLCVYIYIYTHINQHSLHRFACVCISLVCDLFSEVVSNTVYSIKQYGDQ
jgi:hypothetical protein